MAKEEKLEHSLAWDILKDFKKTNRMLLISNIILGIALIILILF